MRVVFCVQLTHAGHSLSLARVPALYQPCFNRFSAISFHLCCIFNVFQLVLAPSCLSYQCLYLVYIISEVAPQKYWIREAQVYGS